MPFVLSGCKFVDKKTREAMKPVTLNYWRVFDNAGDFDELIKKYQALHPNISINYKKLRFEEYEQELLNAFAEDRGPDIFSIHNTWLTKYQSKLLPLPDNITLPYQFVQGTIKKEVITQMKTEPTITIDQIKKEYVPVVADDVIKNSIPRQGVQEGSRQKIYGLPLSVDTMVMYFNRDLLNSGGVTQAPQTWKQFQEAVTVLTKIGANNELEKPVVPFGTINVERYFDILSLLMMQNGTQMINEKKEISFDKPRPNSEIKELPASQALSFYTDFSNPIKEVYSWNTEQQNGLDMFIEGKLPFFFGYSYHLPIIQAGSPEFRFGISQMPQIEGNPKVNYANYWVETVSNKTENINEAWDFVQFITAPQNVGSYLTSSQKPTAVRSLVNTQIDDEIVGVFAEQVISAKSWYNGFDIIATEKIFGEMIDSVNANREETVDYDIIIKRAKEKVSQTMVE